MNKLTPLKRWGFLFQLIFINMKIIVTEQQYRLIREQMDSRMPFQPETFGYNPNKPQTTKGATQKQQQFYTISTTNFQKSYQQRPHHLRTVNKKLGPAAIELTCYL